MMPYPPQGLLHLNAYLALHGISSSIFDTTFSSFDKLTTFLLEHHPNIIGIYCNLLTRINIVKIIRFIRREESLEKSIIIVGGPDVRNHTENYITSGADFCVTGEGEETLRELIMQLEVGITDFSAIRGISYKGSKGGAISTPERPFIKNIDELPFPDFERINISDYFKTWKNRHGFTSLTISTMRGCPYFCKWCSKAVYGNSYRRRSPENVVVELAQLDKLYHPDQFWFVDDVFTISKSWLQDYLDQSLKNRLRIRYECITRADKMDEETIRLLKESGCFKVWIGGESGSQSLLDRMDRRVKAEQVREMIILSKKFGLETGTFLMLGYPGETIKDIDETLQHLKQSSPDHFTISLAHPIKGTSFYSEVESTVKVPGSRLWGEYSDWDLEFTRTYKAGFYKHAIRYLNHQMAVYSCKSLTEHLSFHYIKHRLTALFSRFLMFFYTRNVEIS